MNKVKTFVGKKENKVRMREREKEGSGKEIYIKKSINTGIEI